jgi:hypothetical protein
MDIHADILVQNISSDKKAIKKVKGYSSDYDLKEEDLPELNWPDWNCARLKDKLCGAPNPDAKGKYLPDESGEYVKYIPQDTKEEVREAAASIAMKGLSDVHNYGQRVELVVQVESTKFKNWFLDITEKSETHAEQGEVMNVFDDFVNKKGTEFSAMLILAADINNAGQQVPDFEKNKVSNSKLLKSLSRCATFAAYKKFLVQVYNETLST